MAKKKEVKKDVKPIIKKEVIKVVKPNPLKFKTEIEKIAYMCHQANKAWCEAHKDYSEVDWANIPKWHKDSLVAGVEFRIANPHAGVAKMHNKWYSHKTENGWKYGKVKNIKKKIHPMLIGYQFLSEMERMKTPIFCSMVDLMK